MDFALTDAHELLRKTVHEFAEREIRPKSLAYDESQEYPMEWARAMAKLGLLGVFVPEKYGGSGLDAISYAIAIEELSWGDASAGVIAAVNKGLVCEPILRFGTEAQKKAFLPKLAAGEWMGAYCLTEPNSGSDAAAMRTTAKLEGDHWGLNGAKIFVTNALHANVLVVYARTGTEKSDIGAFLGPKPTKGGTARKKESKL